MMGFSWMKLRSSSCYSTKSCLSNWSTKSLRNWSTHSLGMIPHMVKKLHQNLLQWRILSLQRRVFSEIPLRTSCSLKLMLLLRLSYASFVTSQLPLGTIISSFYSRRNVGWLIMNPLERWQPENLEILLGCQSARIRKKSILPTERPSCYSVGWKGPWQKYHAEPNLQWFCQKLPCNGPRKEKEQDGNRWGGTSWATSGYGLRCQQKNDYWESKVSIGGGSVYCGEVPSYRFGNVVLLHQKFDCDNVLNGNHQGKDRHEDKVPRRIVLFQRCQQVLGEGQKQHWHEKGDKGDDESDKVQSQGSGSSTDFYF